MIFKTKNTDCRKSIIWWTHRSTGGYQLSAKHRRRTDYPNFHQLFPHWRLKILIGGNYQLIFVSFKKSQEVEFIKHKYEPTPNEPRKDWKKLRLSWVDWNSSTEQVFISGSSYGFLKSFYKWKAKVLQLNGAFHIKRMRRLRQKVWSPVCPFCWYGRPG